MKKHTATFSIGYLVRQDIMLNDMADNYLIIIGFLV